MAIIESRHTLWSFKHLNMNDIFSFNDYVRVTLILLPFISLTHEIVK